MAVLAPTDWQHPTLDPTMDPTGSSRQQRSSPANDHPSPHQAQGLQQQQQHQLLMPQQQSLVPQSPYTFPAQQQPQGGWTPSINATPFYPSFYQPQLQQQQQQQGQPFNAQLPPAAYIDQANAQLAQWAYQQMMFNAQHGFSPAMPPQHQRPGGALPSPTDYFAQNQISSPFNGFPSGTPPPHAHRGGAGDQHSVPYPGFHPYRRPTRQQSNSTNTSDAGDWRTAPPINHPPHAPYMRPDASGSTSSINSNTSSQRQRTNSNQSGHSGHGVPAPPPGSANRSRSNTASSATSSSARNTPPPPSSSPSQRNPHHRNGSSSSASSTATATSTRPPGITPSVPTTATSPATSASSSSSISSPVPRLTRPSPLSQGNFTAAEKRMSRDDSDLAAMMHTQPTAIPSRSGGIKGRLKRALSFNATQTLKEEEMEQDDDVSIKASVLNGASSSKLKGKALASPSTDSLKIPSSSKPESSRGPLPDDASSTATIQTKKKGRAASLFNARFNASTDNISLSSTVSSASVMIRKLGSLGNIARRNSLAGITSLFKDKDKDKEGGGDKDKKKKGKKGAKAEASVASVSHVTAELDRTGDWTVGTDMNGLTPAAKLARQHTLKSNAEAAARAKEKAEREASAAATSANDALAKANATRARASGSSNGTSVNGVAGVPSWDKNTATRNGAVSPRSGGSIKIAEDGTRVLLEDDDEESEDGGHYGSSHGHQYYNAEGWEDDEDWDVGPAGEAVEEDVTIRQGLQGTSLEENHDVEPWAVDVRRSVERIRVPAKGILKYAGTYDQAAYSSDRNAPQVRARSNSYNSPPSQSEVGPLAHVPSTDPDHIDGIRHHSSQHDSAPESGPIIPSLPTLAFDSRISMSFVTGSKEVKELKDLPDPPAGSSNILGPLETSNRTSAIFQNPTFNSSAPVLSTIGTSSPTVPHRSATNPPKRLTFATSLAVYDTFSPSMYDRRSEPATWSRLTPALAQRIKEELNSYKMEEMEVHASSRIHTQFFV